MIVLILVLLQMVIFLFFAEKVFHIRPKCLHKIITIAILVTIAMSGLLLLSKQQLNPIILFISSSFILFKYYKGNRKNKFLYIIYFILMTTISEFIVVNLTKLFIHSFSVQEYGIDFSIGALLVNVLQIVFMDLYRKIVVLDLKLISTKFFVLLLILPLTTCLFIFSIPNYFIIIGNKGSLKLFSIVLGLMISNLIIIYMITQIVRDINLKFKYEELENEKILNKIHSAYLVNRHQQNYNILHKIKKNLFSIIQNAKDCNNSEILKISDDIYKDISQMMVLSTIGPKTLNIIIDDKISTISENNIKFKVVFEYEDFSFMKIKDQFEMFSLLLDESMNEVLHNNNDYKYLMLKCRLIRGCVQLSLIYNGKIISSIDKLKSTLLNYGGNLIYDSKGNYTTIIITFNNREENCSE